MSTRTLFRRCGRDGASARGPSTHAPLELFCWERAGCELPAADEEGSAVCPFCIDDDDADGTKDMAAAAGVLG